MKKVLAILTALILATFMLAACGGGTSSSVAPAPVDSGTAPAPAGESYNISLITMDQMDQHWVTVDAGCQQAVTEIGADKINYNWLAPDTKDDAKQIEQINNAVADGANAILLAAMSPTGVDTAVQAAIDAGVTVVYVDSPASVAAAATFSTNNEAAGKTAGEEMKKALDAAGVTSGDIGIVNVNNSTQSIVDREAGFRSAFDGTDFTILETQYSDGDAVKSKDIAASYITQGVVGIFGTNEGCTVGTGNAIGEDGNKIIGVGFDKSDAILELVKADSLLCTMAQNPDKMGYEGMKTAYGVLAGEIQPTGDVVDTGVSVLNKDNI